MAPPISRLLLLACAVGPASTGCSVSAPPAEPPVIRARFDPEAGVIPKPTDVLRDADAGHLAIPDAPADLAGKTAAEIALIHALNTRDAWPTRMQAELQFSGALRPSSIDARSLRIFEVANGELMPVMLPPKLDPEEAPDRLRVDPPAGGWKLGGKYVLAAIAGTHGLAGLHGERVVADAVFYFLRVKEPLTEHVGAIPGTDLADQQAKAEKLEKIRLELAPYFEKLEAQGIARADIVSLWSFSVTEYPEVLMDKDAGKMPLPSDFLRDPVSRLIDIPVRDDDSTLQRNTKMDLRSFDGFALSADLSFELSAPIDPRTLAAGSVRLFALHPEAGKAEEVPITLASSRGDQAITVTLADRPLSPATDHVLVITGALKDARGHTVQPMMPGMLAMLDAPVFENGASTIGAVGAEDAARVEPVRKSLIDALALLQTTGAQARDQVTAAWPFHTMSIVPQMQRARDAAALLDLSPDPTDVTEKSTVRAALDFPLAAITLLRVAKVYEGKILVPDFLDPFTRKARADGKFEPREVSFIMTIPNSARADQPLKTVIFGHGLMAERHFVLAVADALAGEGLAVIGIDFPYHGERTHCVWTGPQCIVNPLDQTGPPICPNPCESGTTCTPDGQCVDNGGMGNHLSNWPLLNYPQASGGAFLDVDNLVGTRDHFYQSVTDLSALLRSLKEGAWKEAIGYDLDPQVGYVGQSLGGIMGALFAATHPEIAHAVLNVPGADLIELFRGSTVFSPQFDAFLARQNITPGTAEHEQLLNVARWIMDGVDPQNFADFLLRTSIETGAPLPERSMLIQMATLDVVIQNEQTKLLERLSGVQRTDYTAEHAFITIPLEPAYPRGVREASQVLSRGVLP